MFNQKAINITPKNAVIIVLLGWVITVVIFTIFYVNKKPAIAPNQGLNTGQAGADLNSGSMKPLNPVEEKVNQIIEEAKNSSTSTPGRVRQEIIGTINDEIIKQEQTKPLEEKTADLKEQAERQKIIDKINNQIKQSTETSK
ncbi:MAG: hypothetical protein WCL13_01375 [bacterium]